MFNCVSSCSRRSACDGWLNEILSSILVVSAPTKRLSFHFGNLSPVYHMMLDGLIDGTQNIRGLSMPGRNHG